MRTALALSLAFAVSAMGCGGSSRTAPTSPSGSPVLTAITPSSAAVGDMVTISGSGFAPSGNAVRIGLGYLLGVVTSDSTSLRFVLPAALSPCPPSAQVCVALAVVLTPGTYPVSVVDADGTSNELSLQVVVR